MTWIFFPSRLMALYWVVAFIMKHKCVHTFISERIILSEWLTHLIGSPSLLMQLKWEAMVFKSYWVMFEWQKRSQLVKAFSLFVSVTIHWVLLSFREMFNLPNKAGAETILYFLFNRLDPALCHQEFRFVVYSYFCSFGLNLKLKDIDHQ